MSRTSGASSADDPKAHLISVVIYNNDLKRT